MDIKMHIIPRFVFCILNSIRVSKSWSNELVFFVNFNGCSKPCVFFYWIWSKLHFFLILTLLVHFRKKHLRLRILYYVLRANAENLWFSLIQLWEKNIFNQIVKFSTSLLRMKSINPMKPAYSIIFKVGIFNSFFISHVSMSQRSQNLAAFLATLYLLGLR